ncbi:MAG: cytochrome c peroxidase, partial [Pirellulaceae bacterium]
RGERLFFNANLSHDSWMSCHSCHTDGHTNGLLNDNFSDASFGAPKRVLSLLGRANTEPFAWAGTADTLQAQIHKSLTHTMQADDPPTDEQLTALAAYVETLAPPPSIDLMRGVQDPEAIERGRQLFGNLQCTNCHQPPVYTTPESYDVGIHDKQGSREFNPPTLLGVGQRGPYFHDNRAASLEDVFLKHKHQLDEDLSANELKDLLAFLRSL